MTGRPRLLDAQMREKARLSPVSLSLSLRLTTLSTARMTLAAGDEEVRVNDWVEIFRPGESAGVFRVTAVETDYARGLRQVELVHGAALLSDWLLPGETHMGPAPAGEAIGWLLEQAESLWTMGRCDAGTDLQMTFTDANVLACLWEALRALGDYRAVFDQQGLPWQVHVVASDPQEAAVCELRRARNAVNVRVTLDRSDMATRLFPVGRGGLTIAEVNGGALFLEENTGTWGRVARMAMLPGIGDAAQLKAAGQAMLHRISSPLVTVEIDGLDLAEVTGEPLDRLTLGRVCRLALPEAGVTVNERISALEWDDVLGDGQRVRVTLANRAATLSGLTGQTAALLERTVPRVIREAQERG